MKNKHGPRGGLKVIIFSGGRRTESHPLYTIYGIYVMKVTVNYND